jgi:DNA-binding NtrC family response regulator
VGKGTRLLGEGEDELAADLVVLEGKGWLSQQSHDERSGGKLHLSQKVAAKEKEVIEEALRESQGRVFGPSGAAAKLGIARSTLESKIQSLNINKNRFKSKPRS